MLIYELCATAQAYKPCLVQLSSSYMDVDDFPYILYIIAFHFLNIINM